MDINAIKPAINSYLSNVQKHVRVSKALVFGSIAMGTATPTSDIDLLVISDDFTDIDADERSKLLYRASVGFPYDLHVFGTTNNEFTNASPLTTLGQIRRGKTLSVLQ